MKRMILGVVAGLVVGIVLIALMEGVAHKLYPVPGNININDKASLQQMMMNMPLGAYLMVLLAYICGALGGGITATVIDKSGKYLPALVVSGLLLLAGVANFAMLPHPLWFMVAATLSYPVFAVGGAWLVKKITDK